MKKMLFILLFQVFVIGLFADNGLPPGKFPVKVNVALYIADIDSINTSKQNFEARVFYVINWHDKRLVHKGPNPVIKKLTEVWHPNIQIINQQKVFKSFPEVVEIMPDGEVIYKQGGWGIFSQPLKLKRFPFDKQKIAVQMVSASGYETDKVEITADDSGVSGIADELSVADWKIFGWEEIVKPFKLKNFDERPAIIFSFNAKRLISYYVVKMILPLVMIVMMSWAVFWMDPHNVGSNVGISITSMLTLIAYRFSADTILPRLSYLTSLDYFILASTILVFLSLLQNLTTSALAKREKMKQARRLDIYCRFGFPLIFFIIILETMFFRFLM